MLPLNQYLIKNNLNIDSIKQIIGKSHQVMVYGFAHCHYEAIYETLIDKLINNTSIKVFNYKVGDDCSITLTSEKQVIEKIKTKSFRELCKAGITNIVLENFKLIKEEKPIIPVIFCIDIDANPYPSNARTISSKNPNLNKRITHSEIRRCYKLCKKIETSESLELQEMAKAAKQTFKFVKVTMIDQQIILKEILPPWEQQGWNIAWKKRMKVKKSIIKKAYRVKIKENLVQAKFNQLTAIVEQLDNSINRCTCSIKNKCCTKNIKLKRKIEKSKKSLIHILDKRKEYTQKVESLIPQAKAEALQWHQQLLTAAKNYNRNRNNRILLTEIT